MNSQLTEQEIEVPEYVKRLRVEKDELCAKAIKLNNFLESEPSIDEESLNLLKIQLAIMASYSRILSIRCKREEDKLYKKQQKES